jgi:osomolarity two-component system sensor histidine kinase SLN1
MQSMFIPLQLATNARGLELVTDLDKNIDHVRHAAVTLGTMLTC